MPATKFQASRKEIAAWLIGCLPESLLSSKDYGDDGFVAIGPDGKKYSFSTEQLDKAYTAMELDAAAKAVERARSTTKPAAKPKAEPKPKQQTTRKKTTTKKKA